MLLLTIVLPAVEANARRPPRLDSASMWVLIGALVAGVLAWQFLRWQRFRAPSGWVTPSLPRSGWGRRSSRMSRSPDSA